MAVCNKTYSGCADNERHECRHEFIYWIGISLYFECTSQMSPHVALNVTMAVQRLQHEHFACVSAAIKSGLTRLDLTGRKLSVHVEKTRIIYLFYIFLSSL